MKESISIISADAESFINQPDVKKINRNQIHTTTGNSVPRHWGNSSHMSGRTGMGANPAEGHNVELILTYKEWVENNKNA